MRSKVNFDLNQNQYDALFDLFFNHGYGCKTGGCWSPDDLIEAINCGDFPHLLKLMATFVYSDGKRDVGLAARRAADAKLFQQPVGNPRPLVAGSRNARIARSSSEPQAHARKHVNSAGILTANLRRATSGRVVTVRGSRWGARAAGCGLVQVTAFAVGVTPYPARIVGRTSKQAFVLRWQTPRVSGQYDWLVQATQKCGRRFRVAHATVNVKPAAPPPATRAAGSP
jgi:hypothetical protein